jgi:ABC-type multidrug transport system fused ATPase/permease subunit
MPEAVTMTPAHRTEREWIIRQLRPFARLHVFSFLCISVGSGTALADPLIMKWLIDKILPARQWHLLPIAAGCFFAAYLLQLALFWTATLATFRAVQRMILRIRIDLLEHLQQLAADYHEQTAVGDLLFRMEQDVEQVGELGGDIVPNALRLVLMTILVFGAMVWLNWRLTCLILPLMPVFLIVHQRYENALQVCSEAVQEHSGKRSALLQEVLAAVLQIQLLGRERAQLRRFAKAAATAFRSGLQRELSAMRFSMATMVVVVFGITVILAYGGREVMLGTFTIGGLVAFYSYLAGLFGPLGGAVELYSRLHRVSASIRRILEIEHAIPTVQNRPGARPLPKTVRGAISLREVTFGYATGATALDGINIEVMPGDRIAIVGPSGSGKSTIAKLATRLYEIDHGAILLDGTDIRDIELRSLRSAISLVPQDPLLFCGSLRENLLLGNPQAGLAELEEAANIAQLMPLIRAREDGWDQQLSYSGKGLSGGERQRVALARAILQHRPILILDEATSALDAPTEAAFLRALKDSFPSRTTLIISHREAVARWADRVIVLNEGRVLEQGDHTELNREGKLYYRLWRQHSPEEAISGYLGSAMKTA